MKLLRRFFRAALMALLLCLSFASSCAAGPRFVAGAQWDNRSKPMSWYRPDVQYFVDAGPLSAYVDHVTAAALVDAAATVWNVPGVNFRLGNGGVLDEDVSSDNVYLGASGPVWPADLQSSRYTAKQIAVVFDADGAITDMLLGSGASAPSNCRTNAVTESVDLFIQPGNIAHALIIVNGRCTGSLPEQQLQLRYQLMRTFGRVIGLAWSQLNDNVFTGTPEPTYQQQLHWPIMHPIDVICGSYTYQCLPQPFTLRDDDVAALHLVNSTVLNAQIPGMIVVEGWLWFPDGEGMNGVNVVVHRDYPWTEYHTDSYEDVSSVTGFAAMGDFGNPVTGTAADTAGIAGFPEGFAPGYYLLAGIPPLSQFEFTNVFLSSQPVNPLYVGPYSVGPYRLGTVTQSGSTFSAELGGLRPGTMQSPGRVRIADAASTCNGSADGTEDAPARIAQDGVWVGRLCGVAHVPWTFFAVRAGRTATIDVTSTDESGNATESKAMPLIGLWHASDPTGTLPTLARTATAFNTVNAGTTRLRASFSANESIRMAIADRRGEGRPDFTFLARVLYADAVLPTHMPPGGGALHITGVGFQQGTVVTVGGVLANVVALSSTTIDAVAPSLAALGGNVVNDVAIIDPRTGASSIITGGLTYGAGSGDVLSLVTAPGGSVDVGAPTPFAVRLNDADGKPVANAGIVFRAASGSVVFNPCNLAECTAVTDATGLAQVQAVPQAAGAITLRASSVSSSVQVSFTAVQAMQALDLLRPTEYIAAAAGAVFHPAVTIVGGNAVVTWSSSSSRVVLGDSHPGGNTASIDAVAALRDGETASVRACAWTSVCVSQALIGVAAADLRAVAAGGDAQSVAAAATLESVSIRIADTQGHPVAGAAVQVYQQVTGWQPACGASGRCPTPPLYGRQTTLAMSDDDGMIRVDPLQYAATAAVTRITASVGTSGTVTVTLQKTP